METLSCIFNLVGPLSTITPKWSKLNSQNVFLFLFTPALFFTHTTSIAWCKQVLNPRPIAHAKINYHCSIVALAACKY